MPLTLTQKKKVRTSFKAYCQAAVANEPRIHYSQQRPFRFHDNPWSSRIVLDCSGFVCNVFWNAMNDLGIYLHDPLDERYTGWGNTGTMEAFLRRHGKSVTDVNGFLVGDIARWGVGNHAHAAICSKAGSVTTARFTSHGREAGPNDVALRYRSDLVGVWRHPALI